MTTTATATAADTILALDLGQYKSVACVSRSADDHRFTRLDTSRHELARLISRHQPAAVLIEACLLAGWVRDLCAGLGVACLAANAATEAWKFKHLKRKTDRDDALRLAEVYRLGRFPAVAIPDKGARERRALVEARQRLVGRRVALQNRIRAAFVGQGPPAPRGAKAWAQLGLAGMAQHARPPAGCGPDELWRGRLHLALAELAYVKGLLDQADQKLDALARADAGARLLQTIPAPGRAPPRRWRPSCPGRGCSARPSRSRPTAAPCRASTNRPTPTTAAASPSAGPGPCASSWSNAPG